MVKFKEKEIYGKVVINKKTGQANASLPKKKIPEDVWKEIIKNKKVKFKWD